MKHKEEIQERLNICIGLGLYFESGKNGAEFSSEKVKLTNMYKSTHQRREREDRSAALH